MKKHNFNTYEKACKIYSKAFSRYISPSVYDKMNESGWFFDSFSFGRNAMDIDIRTIQEHLHNGVSVKCGYMATSIRGYHDFFIISKELEPCTT